MGYSEIIERRLRIASFLFVAAAILLAFGSLILASKTLNELISQSAAISINPAEVSKNIYAIISAERFVNRCLFMSMIFLQIGMLFLIYLLITKVNYLQQNI